MSEKLNRFFSSLSSVYHNKVQCSSLFPGVWLCAFEQIEKPFGIDHLSFPNVMELTFCKAGRIDWKLNNNNHILLGPGDYSLHFMDKCTSSKLSFSSKKCSGFILYIDFDEAPYNLTDFIESSYLTKSYFENKFLSDRESVSFSGNNYTNSIFSAFYNESEEFQLSYQKLKVIELLLYLIKVSPHDLLLLSEYQKEQLDCIREVHNYLIEHLQDRITIEELSRKYHMNTTTLKNLFKSVYKESIASHINHHRMEIASRLLQDSSNSIYEIAQTVGYESQSKFTSCFKSYYQMTPSEYRKKQVVISESHFI